MMNQSESFAFLDQFMPHGSCFLWQQDILWLHMASDAIIAIAYFSIPFALLFFTLKGGEIPFKGTLGLFSAFILACGMTHIMGIWTIWHPDYYAAGFLKGLTAIISILTATSLWPIVNKAITLPNLFTLQEANKQLVQEIQRRQDVEQSLRRKAEELEKSNETLHDTNRLMTGRELRMIELKREVNDLCQELNRPLLYHTDIG